MNGLDEQMSVSVFLYVWQVTKDPSIMDCFRYMHSHYAYYIREMKIKAYAQLLESYRSLTLEYMAEAFGVTEDYMDGELSRFIADGRLHCKIDKV